eukprot:jgi/Tetstr1/427327/TSEL_017496.t1
MEAPSVDAGKRYRGDERRTTSRSSVGCEKDSELAKERLLSVAKKSLGTSGADSTEGDQMFGADPDSVAGMAKAYMKFRKPGQQHEMDASREVAALFLAVQSQVSGLLQGMSQQVADIAEEAEAASKKGLRFQPLKILRMVLTEHLEHAGSYLQDQIHEHAKAAGMVMEGAHRRFRSQAAEIVSLRNELQKAFLGDNPGWVKQKLKLEREIKELKRLVRRLQDENGALRLQLEQLGETMAPAAEDTRIEAMKDKLVGALQRWHRHRVLMFAWMKWVSFRYALRDERRREEKRALEAALKEAKEVQASAPPPPPPVQKYSEYTQTDPPPPPPPCREAGAQTDPLPETVDKAALETAAAQHRDYVMRRAARLMGSMRQRLLAAMFNSWRDHAAHQKLMRAKVKKLLERWQEDRSGQTFAAWRDFVRQRQQAAAAHHDEKLLRRAFRGYCSAACEGDSAYAAQQLRRYLEAPLLKAVQAACYERELRGDLEVLLEECLALLVRCLKGGVDKSRRLQHRLRTQVGRVLDARWIVRHWAEGSLVKGEGGSDEALLTLPARPWEDVKSTPRELAADPSSATTLSSAFSPRTYLATNVPPRAQTTEAMRRQAYAEFDDLRRKHVGLPVSLRPDAGKLPKDEELPQPAGLDSPRTMAARHLNSQENLQYEEGSSLGFGDWEFRDWNEGWTAFTELTDAMGALLKSITDCPANEFWRGFWRQWRRAVADDDARAESGKLMDTLHVRRAGANVGDIAGAGADDDELASGDSELFATPTNALSPVASMSTVVFDGGERPMRIPTDSAVPPALVTAISRKSSMAPWARSPSKRAPSRGASFRAADPSPPDTEASVIRFKANVVVDNPDPASPSGRRIGRRTKTWHHRGEALSVLEPSRSPERPGPPPGVVSAEVSGREESPPRHAGRTHPKAWDMPAAAGATASGAAKAQVPRLALGQEDASRGGNAARQPAPPPPWHARTSSPEPSLQVLDDAARQPGSSPPRRDAANRRGASSAGERELSPRQASASGERPPPYLRTTADTTAEALWLSCDGTDGEAFDVDASMMYTASHLVRRSVGSASGAVGPFAERAFPARIRPASAAGNHSQKAAGRAFGQRQSRPASARPRSPPRQLSPSPPRSSASSSRSGAVMEVRIPGVGAGSRLSRHGSPPPGSRPYVSPRHESSPAYRPHTASLLGGTPSAPRPQSALPTDRASRGAGRVPWMASQHPQPPKSPTEEGSARIDITPSEKPRPRLSVSLAVEQPGSPMSPSPGLKTPMTPGSAGFYHSRKQSIMRAKSGRVRREQGPRTKHGKLSMTLGLAD